MVEVERRSPGRVERWVDMKGLPRTTDWRSPRVAQRLAYSYAVTTQFWRDRGNPDAAPQGHHIAAIPGHSLKGAAQALAHCDFAPKLKIRSGEHLAALLLTAFCGLPIEADESGGIDLLLCCETAHTWPFGTSPFAAFEVKSFPGKFRGFEGRRRIEEQHVVTIQTAADILQTFGGQLQQAITSLDRKVGDHCTSRNVFLIVHPLDGFAIEATDQNAIAVIGHRLPHPSTDIPLDSLWVLWHPGFLCMWSRRSDCWMDMLFGSFSPDSPLRDEDWVDPDISLLQSAEVVFLQELGLPVKSPWLYVMTHDGFHGYRNQGSRK